MFKFTGTLKTKNVFKYITDLYNYNCIILCYETALNCLFSSCKCFIGGFLVVNEDH